jgi:uroporphyrinogen decarboxylase
MNAMTPRQRVSATLNHTEPDRVPFDCTFTIEAYCALEKALNLPPDAGISAGSPSLNVSPSLDMLERMRIDLCYIGLNAWPGEAPFEYGQERYTDIWGVGYRRVDSKAGFEYVNDVHPLANATLADLDAYPWPDPAAPELTEGLRQKAQAIFNQTSFALVGKFSTPIVEQASALRGLEQLFMDLAVNPQFAAALFARLTAIAMRLNEAGLSACGEYLQILRLAGDDMGSQRGTLLSPAMFRRQVKPFFAQLYSHAKQTFVQHNPNGKLMAHTDGDVYPILPDYIEMGLDLLNPVQPYVAEMDHERLKHEFGAQLAFHGGMDIRHVLPFGSPAEVREEVEKTIRALAPGGGYILAPTHYLLPDVPPANMLALRDAVLEFGQYPLTNLL